MTAAAARRRRRTSALVLVAIRSNQPERIRPAAETTTGTPATTSRPQCRAQDARTAIEKAGGEEGIATVGDRLEHLSGLQDDDVRLARERAERLELGAEVIPDLLRPRPAASRPRAPGRSP